jgi:hypothetical protein
MQTRVGGSGNPALSRDASTNTILRYVIDDHGDEIWTNSWRCSGVIGAVRGSLN